MKVAKKVDITLEYSSVANSLEDEYASGTTYATDDVVKVSFESDGLTALTPVVEYVSLADSNTGNYPPDSPTKWGEVRVSNRWAMFDDYLNTVTSDTEDIEVSVTSNRSNTVALFGLVGSQVTFELSRGGGSTEAYLLTSDGDELLDANGDYLIAAGDIEGGTLIDSETINLRTLTESGWYSWLYDEYEYKTKAIWEYPKYTDATLTVIISATGGTAACGGMVIGTSVLLGTTSYSPVVGIDDYSIIDTDALNRLYLSQGNYADRAEINMWIENKHVDLVRRKLADLRGTLAIWDLNNEESDFDSLRIYGYFRTFDITIPGPSISYCSIEIGGAT